jgi:KUP system potassium uptake protein
LPGINLILAVGAISLVLFFKVSNNLANAYGLAVTGTMMTTTIAYAAITYAQTKRFPWIALLLIALDLSLFLPNSIKFATGGYIPVTIGFAFALVLISWSRTRAAIRAQLADRVMPLDEFAEATKDIPRVRNTAVVLTATPRVAPITLLHWIKIGQVLHQQVIVLTLTILHEPRVPDAERLQIIEHDLNLFSVEARFGFMEEVNLTKIEPELRKIVNAPADRNLYYMLGREILICERSYDIFTRIYRKLSAMSRPQAESLRIPLGQAIELGVAIRL